MINETDQALQTFSTRDITEHKLAEEELRLMNHSLMAAVDELQARTEDLASMTQQLWQASKLATMGELAASVAHELNNPLATITLHVEVLIGQLAADSRSTRSLLVIEREFVGEGHNGADCFAGDGIGR